MNLRRLPLVTALLMLACSIPAGTPVSAQEARPMFSTGVALVPITAVVRDGRRRIVRDLLRDDFVVLENDQPRPILDFRATDQGPVSLAILFDTSGSMRGPHVGKGREIVDRLLASLDHQADEAALFTFDRAIRQETPFTTDRDHVRRALAASDAWGLTSLYDAIADTARRVADHRAERRAVIVITDGLDTSSTLTGAEVSGIASSIDVPVYVIAVAPQRARGVAASDGATLSDLAVWTGGDLRVAEGPGTDRMVGELMAELRQQYFLAIESSATSGWYRLDVTTRRRDLKVRTRSGYFASAAAGH